MRRVGGTSRLVTVPHARGLGAGDDLYGVCRRDILLRALVSHAEGVAGSTGVCLAAIATVEKIRMNNQSHSTLEKLKPLLEIFALVVGIFVGIGGSTVGLIAWVESRNANRLNVDTQQDNDEIKLNEFLLNNPSLCGLWAKFPNETNALEVAQKKILLLASADEDEYSKLCREQANPDLTPLTVQKLYAYVWDGNSFYDARRVRLRKAYNVMKWISEQIEYSFEANQRKQLNEGDFQGWVSYLDEICTHPLFLTVLQDEHDKNFPSQEYCAFVRQRVLAQPQGREILSLVYTNMLDSSWADSLGSEASH